jgi:regulator of RNase E activity RraB
MSREFPDDSDGDALRLLVTNGSDLSKLMYIDFQVAMPDEPSAKALADIAWKLGYRVRVYDNPECDTTWTCECSTRMLATYDGVIAVQAELAELATPLGGYPDGWGSFGNKPGGQYPAD